MWAGNSDRRWWLALNPRKNKDQAKKQQVKGWGKGGDKPPHRGGTGGLFGGGKKDDDNGKKKGWFS